MPLIGYILWGIALLGAANLIRNFRKNVTW